MNNKVILLAIGLFLLLGLPVFAQSADASRIETEYYGLKWGCSPKDLLAKYPSAYFNGTNNVGDSVYYLDTAETTRIFFFENDKLYSGRIAYLDCTEEKSVALAKKVVDTYGSFDNSNSYSRDGNEYIEFIREHSKNIRIVFQTTAFNNIYGARTLRVVITYTNKILYDQILQDRIKSMQEDLEL